MAELINAEISKEMKKNNKLFFDKLTSDMNYKDKMQGDAITFDWLDIVENACPYLDNIVRNPKLILINEAEVEPIEKTRKVTVDTVKDLARHTHYIEDLDPKTQDVRPSRLLNIRSEETYNIYENRFLYTVLFFFKRFILKKEKELDELLINRDRKLEYAATTRVNGENINMQVLLKASDISQATSNKDLLEKIKEVRKRINRIKDYMSTWDRSELIKSLERAKVKLVNPPIKKTNIILKNPNFQIAVKLFDFLYNYKDDNGDIQKGLDSDGSNLLMGLLDHAFLVNYYVMESVKKTKKEQKEKLNEFALSLINEEIKRLLDLLRQCGFKITDAELLKLIAQNMGTNKNGNADKATLANNDIKKKFQSAMDDYLDRVQEYL